LKLSQEAAADCSPADASALRSRQLLNGVVVRCKVDFEGKVPVFSFVQLLFATVLED
jgi:hypothetical protein